MSRVFVQGIGAVSPAGWGVAPLCEALNRNHPLPAKTLSRPGWQTPLRVRVVPPPPGRVDILEHPRLRRAGAMSRHVVSAALEALGVEDLMLLRAGKLRLGVIVCTMAGCVTYSRKFYEEILRNPATASPAVFPETVFNAPASHLGACLNSPFINYTMVGDDGVFLTALALAASWLDSGRVEGCLVIGAEESDWIVADAVRLFSRDTIYGDGAGALYLKKASTGKVELAAVTDSFPYTQKQSRHDAILRMKGQLPPGSADEFLCEGGAKNSAWSGWPGERRAIKPLLGEVFAASAAWQCVAACEAVRDRDFSASNVSVAGVNQQAIGARFTKPENKNRQ